MTAAGRQVADRRTIDCMKRAPSAVVALAAAFALAACGGGGDGGSEAKLDPRPAQITKPGTVLALGERAFVRYAGLGANNEPTVNTDLGVTVLKVEEGDASDIEGLGESTTPWYVHVEYENHGEAGLAVAGGTRGRFSIVGSDGEDYDTAGVISIGGDFDLCPRADAEATLAAQEAIADCAIFAVTEGVSPREVRFVADYAVQEEPVGWKVESAE
jgi:hypothetical protein